MEPLFTNVTKLTADMYKKGIIDNYKATHKLLRAVSTAYAIIMLIISYVFFLDVNLTVAIPFLIFGVVIILWNTFGYSFAAKKSFMKFAVMHSSHYCVDMNYRFYEDRFEQETTKTKMTVFYKDFSNAYDMEELLLLIYNKSVIIIDKGNFEGGEYDKLLKFLENKKLKISRI